ncbi:MAG TPA: YciI family protein [Solirubrobacteraceae bacterium]|nr:YciI family protein [Solirubrobacteraceae bacterium]
MPTYLVTYHGGAGAPPTPEAQQQMMAAFGAWVASVGDAMVDPGAPLAASRSVSSSGTVDGPVNDPIGGYTLLRAADLDAAAQLVANHPFVSRGGTLQVSEAIDLGT